MIKIILLTAIYSAFVWWYWKRKKMSPITKAVLLAPIILAVIWSFILEPFVMTPVKISDDSMNPSFTKGQYYMVNRLTPDDNLARGTVIVFRDKEDSRWLIKRIVGLPEEKVTILNGKIYVNDKELNEPYSESNTIPEGQAIKEGESVNVPKDDIFVLGDNREQSKRDSRLWGTLPKENIIGTVWFKYY